MNGDPCMVEITATTGGRAVSLGRATLPNRRLALRWLRRQAHRLADGPGFQSPAIPNGLRAWADDPAQQDQAMARLEATGPDVLTVLDPTAGLLVTLAGLPVRSRRAVAGYGAPEPPARVPQHPPRPCAAPWRTGGALRPPNRRPPGPGPGHLPE